MFSITIASVGKNDLPGMKIMKARSIVVAIKAARGIIRISLVNISFNDVKSVQTPVKA